MHVCLSQISISPLNLILENCTAAWVRDETREVRSGGETALIAVPVCP